jgi:Fe2+ transport system protein FeoA
MKLAAEGLDIRWEGLRRWTEGGPVAADLTISVSGATVKYNVYLRRDDILLRFQSSDRNNVELAARLLKLAGVGAEVRKEGGRDKWNIDVSTDRLAAGREELRKALAEIVRAAVEKGWVEARKAERWLKKLEEGFTLKEGWPKYYVGLIEGALVVSFSSTNLDSIKREAQRFREMGLVEGVHFSVKKPEEGRNGYVRILREGLAHVAWLSVHGSGRQRELATGFVNYILRRAEKVGKEVHEKAKKIVKEGMSRGL